ncbi:MarR family winged helix-turn-helix transcriptional regulator [Chelatococcus asaccharovorans]|uniref:MarR family transcriptional regulator n=1 Tax=Chelatococcus asaccharovorans TaxID=28210 RepID=A0A2V3U531_9HYPH|nr:MarR family winged helix-turn-helix transcriptional regulator [Chelatococcus asaccharovorans]MBS7703078.1 winged helix-turn-helix transcriptional regulator [Chelatococcus asaccharovorans]PXW57378.1 MarR family transcriptional regulator [Chelatococcus asaccharovorans]
MKKPDSVTDFLSSRLLRLSNTLGLYASRRYRDAFGISLPEWRVLSIIASCEPTTAREVSRNLATDKGWVSLSADSLRRRGLIKGSPDSRDGRRILLTLTAEGRKMHAAVLAVAQWRHERLLACLPEGSAAFLIECLDRLQAEADAMLEESIAENGEAEAISPDPKASERSDRP